MAAMFDIHSGFNAYILTGYNPFGKPFASSVFISFRPAFSKSARNFSSVLTLHVSLISQLLMIFTYLVTLLSSSSNMSLPACVLMFSFTMIQPFSFNIFPHFWRYSTSWESVKCPRHHWFHIKSYLISASGVHASRPTEYIWPTPGWSISAEENFVTGSTISTVLATLRSNAFVIRPILEVVSVYICSSFYDQRMTTIYDMIRIITLNFQSLNSHPWSADEKTLLRENTTRQLNPPQLKDKKIQSKQSLTPPHNPPPSPTSHPLPPASLRSSLIPVYLLDWYTESLQAFHHHLLLCFPSYVFCQSSSLIISIFVILSFIFLENTLKGILREDIKRELIRTNW